MLHALTSYLQNYTERHMSATGSLWRPLTRRAAAGTWRRSSRPFSRPATRCTDGVFRALTGERVQKPWVEAFRERQASDQQAHNRRRQESDDNGRHESDHHGRRESDNGRHTSDHGRHTLDHGRHESDHARHLAPKQMADSRHSVVLPLAQEPWLLDTYMNASGHIRIGTLLMDLDALAGVVADKHTGDGVMTVTAAFDRITINHPLTEVGDLEYSGQVTYASGRSSMEITLQVAKAPAPGQPPKPEHVLITAKTTMVCLDPATKKPVNIPPLRTHTAEERRVFAEGEKNSKARKELARRSLLKQTPNDEESHLIHAIWQKQLQYHDPHHPLGKPSNARFMAATQLQTASIMQPQYRNRHHFMIFGGYLLKQTFELAFCCAASFAHTRPTFVSLDPSTFQNPVPVGSVLYMTSTVVYTDPPLVAGASDTQRATASKLTRVQVRVDTKVRDVEHGTAKPTGQFNYTFTVENDVKVIPRSYTEMMMYVDARRRAMSVRDTVRHADADAGSHEGITE